MTDDDHRLVVLIGGERAGTIVMGTAGRLSMTYDEAWPSNPNATPLSLSMPLARREHGDSAQW